MLERTEQSLTALYNVIKIFPDATLQTLNRYKLLFYFMRVDESPGVQMAALNVIHLVVANKVGGRACTVLSATHLGAYRKRAAMISTSIRPWQDCVANIAEAGVMHYIVVLGEILPSSQPVLLEVLQSTVPHA